MNYSAEAANELDGGEGGGKKRTRGAERRVQTQEEDGGQKAEDENSRFLFALALRLAVLATACLCLVLECTEVSSCLRL